MLRITGKNSSPFTSPMAMSANKIEKKYLVTKLKSEVASITTASSEVRAPCTTGANMCSRASLVRRSRPPMEVTKLC